MAAQRSARSSADFTKPIDLPPLDGIVMANSLHFVKDKAPVLALVRDMLKPSGRLLLVEYDADRGNPYVPHPLSFDDVAHARGPSGFTPHASSRACPADSWVGSTPP